MDLYLFDTIGFVVVNNAISQTRVTALKAQISPHFRPDAEQPNTRACRDVIAVSELVRELAKDSLVIDRTQALINQPMRLIESYATCRLAKSRLPLHNGAAELMKPFNRGVTRNLSQSHAYHDGKLYCMFVKAILYLDDVTLPKDGPFCYIEGSHKANYALLPLLDGESSPTNTIADRGFPTLRTQFVKAGDLLLLNEALMHGTLTKYSDQERTILALSFAPAFVANWRPLEGDEPRLDPGHYEAYEGDIWR